MTNKIKQHLRVNKSYLKWGAARLATKFGCSERTMINILKELRNVKTTYLRSLKNS